MIRFGVAGLALLLVAGCSADPGDERRAQVAAITEAANARDADQVRERVEALVATVGAQRERGELTADEAERLIAAAEAVRTGADVIDEDLLEQRRVEAEREKLEEERKKLEEERKRAEEERKKAEEEREKEDEGKGEDKKKKDEDEDED